MPAQGNPTPPLVGGMTVREPILSGYVFQSGIHKPEHSSILTYKYPQYFLTSLLDRIGRAVPVAQSVFSWNVIDQPRKSGTASSVTGVPGTSATFEIAEFDYDGTANLGYLVEGDIVRTQTGALLLVTAVSASTVLTNKQKVTVVKHDGSTITATDLADGFVFGHVFNAFGEGSYAPKGRLFLPVEDYNVTTILRRSFAITGSELTNKTWLGDGKAWYWTLEDLHRKEFAYDRELLILFGKLGNGGTKVSRGVIDYALNGVGTTYASSTGPSEVDITEHIRKLRVEGGSTEYVVLCGSKFYRHVQLAMRDYYKGGGISFGSHGNNTLGLDVRTYDFMGVKCHFVLYEVFDNPAVAPAVTPSTSAINFSDFSLWLDLGTDSSGVPLIQMKYKELDGISRKFIQAVEVGMVNPNGESSGIVSNSFDGVKIHMLSEIGVEVRLYNRMGFMRANS